jgi:hypothetical protein
LKAVLLKLTGIRLFFLGSLWVDSFRLAPTKSYLTFYYRSAVLSECRLVTWKILAIYSVAGECVNEHSQGRKWRNDWTLENPVCVLFKRENHPQIDVYKPRSKRSETSDNLKLAKKKKKNSLGTIRVISTLAYRAVDDKGV